MPSKDQPWPPKEYPDNSVKRPFQPTLRKRTYTALRDTIDGRKQTLREIADGSGVTWGWLRMFALDRIPDPSCDRIERLYHYLTGATL